MKASIVEHPRLRLIVSKSRSFPDGNREAMDALECRLATLKGRKIYGLACESTDGIEYYAGLVPENEAEERRFSALGFEVRTIEVGTCARVKLLDWPSKIAQIGPTFGALKREYGCDPTKPQIEFYRSQKELHLLLPLPT